MYFLEAAKDMIQREGVESVSVRKVADVAGYSYATLYNYFEDLNHLLWEVKKIMIEDLMRDMREKVSFPLNEKEDIKTMFKEYIQYYLTHPNTFKFFYFYEVRQPKRNIEEADNGQDFSAMWGETFKSFVKSGGLQEGEVEAVAKTLIYAIHGMLTLSFSNNGDLRDEANLYRDLGMIVDYII